MAKKVFCDVCGEEISFHFHGKFSYYELTVGDTQHDLCKKHTKEVQKILKGMGMQGRNLRWV